MDKLHRDTENNIVKIRWKKTHERKRKCGNKYEMEVTALLMYINSGQLSVYMFFWAKRKGEKERKKERKRKIVFEIRSHRVLY